MIIKNAKKIDSLKFVRELDDAGIYCTGVTPTSKTLIVGVSNADDSVAMDVYDAHDPTPESVYSITPEVSLVAVGVDVPLKITGAPKSIVEVDIGLETHDVTLGEDGVGGDTFTALVPGVYYLKFVDQDMSKLRVKIEVVE